MDNKQDRNDEDFSKWLDHTLASTGLNMTEAAEKAELSQSYVSKLRKGKKKNPKADKVIRLAKELKADPAAALVAAGYSPDIASDLTGQQAQETSSIFCCRIEMGRSAFEFSVKQNQDKGDEYAVSIHLPCSAYDQMVPKSVDRIIGQGEIIKFKPNKQEFYVQCKLDDETDELILTVPLKLLRFEER